jgi:hypothetical protein
MKEAVNSGALIGDGKVYSVLQGTNLETFNVDGYTVTAANLCPPISNTNRRLSPNYYLRRTAVKFNP